jgi:hypothetical protein
MTEALGDYWLTLVACRSRLETAGAFGRTRPLPRNLARADLVAAMDRAQARLVDTGAVRGRYARAPRGSGAIAPIASRASHGVPLTMSWRSC